MKKFLIVQTAFIGDVILATPLIEQLKKNNPNCEVDFLLRKGNESLLKNHPHIRKVIIWNKKQSKLKGMAQIAMQIRSEKYDAIFNLQRFLSSGLMVAFSNAKKVIGFKKNPLSKLFNHSLPHLIGQKNETNYKHEVQRNLSLLAPLGLENQSQCPVLYPSETDFKVVQEYKSMPYITIAPTSVWFTKQFHQQKWIDFLKVLPFKGNIYLLGAPNDFDACEEIKQKSQNKAVQNLAGKISLLQSAALQKNAVLNYVNDSAPMHLASSVNAPVCVVYCSTIPEFGFGPLSDFSEVVQVEENLDCRPCGLHGYKECPKGHFNCAQKIKTQQLLDVLKSAELEFNQ